MTLAVARKETHHKMLRMLSFGPFLKPVKSKLYFCSSAAWAAAQVPENRVYQLILHTLSVHNAGSQLTLESTVWVAA